MRARVCPGENVPSCTHTLSLCEKERAVCYCELEREKKVCAHMCQTLSARNLVLCMPRMNKQFFQIAAGHVTDSEAESDWVRKSWGAARFLKSFFSSPQLLYKMHFYKSPRVFNNRPYWLYSLLILSSYMGKEKTVLLIEPIEHKNVKNITQLFFILRKRAKKNTLQNCPCLYSGF
jgi:hypothetical protein